MDYNDKKSLKKLREETNEKFADRVDKILYNICGCSPQRGIIVLNKCIKRANEKIK